MESQNKMLPNEAREVSYAPFAPRDEAEVLRFFEAERVVMASTADRRVHAAVCRDAARSPQITIIIAKAGGEIAGAAVLVTARNSYWKRLWLKHPTAFFVIAARRWRGAGRQLVGVLFRRVPGQTGPPAVLAAGEGDRLWAETAPDIAKLEYIDVGLRHRNRGIGKGLFSAALEAMTRRGIRRLDAQIDLENTPSIRLHESMGARLLHGRSRVVATFDLRAAAPGSAPL